MLFRDKIPILLPMKNQLANSIKQWAIALGFQTVGITDTHLSHYEKHFEQALKNKRHGKMHYLTQNIEKRLHPEALMPNTKSIICVSIPYFTQTNDEHISCYAQIRDYHKVIKKKLNLLAEKIAKETGPFQYRAFVDSAPVLEKALAEKSGNGWIGKNTLLFNKQFGSFCFLGELFTDLEIDYDHPTENHCGNCSKCLNACPTQALIAPYQLDANRCISYLTIEYKGIIPVELRPLIGTKIAGCDQCQSCCPYNQKIEISIDAAFNPHHVFNIEGLIELFSWSEKEFLEKTQGSVIRRIGYECWLRNIAIALGNSPKNPKIGAVLKQKLTLASPLLQEHIQWAIENN